MVEPWDVEDLSVALWHQNQPNIKACKVCKKGLVEDEHITCFLHALHIVLFMKAMMIY